MHSHSLFVFSPCESEIKNGVHNTHYCWKPNWHCYIITTTTTENHIDPFCRLCVSSPYLVQEHVAWQSWQCFRDSLSQWKCSLWGQKSKKLNKPLWHQSSSQWMAQLSVGQETCYMQTVSIITAARGKCISKHTHKHTHTQLTITHTACYWSYYKPCFVKFT